MKSHLLHSLSVGMSLLCAVPLAFAQDLSVNGSIFATGTLDIDGNTASFGTSGANPGYSLIYTDGSPATIDFSASASGANWFWHQGISSPQLKLSNANVLTLFNPATGVAAITLTPAGTTAFTTAVGGSTTELLRLQSTGTTVAGTGQRISGQTDVLSGYLDFKRFATSGPATGLTLGTLGGDVLTIRSSGTSDAGNVGIGTTSPTAKLEVVGDLKVTGGTLTTPSVTLPDGSTLTSARSTTLYNAVGQVVATVAADGKVNFANGVSVGTNPAATITANSTAYLNQTLTNLGFHETSPSPVSSIPVTGNGREVSVYGICRAGGFTYIVGIYYGSATVGGVVLNGSANRYYSFVAKFSASGETQWVRPISGTGSTSLRSIALDSSGNIFVTGSFSGTINLDGIGDVTSVAYDDGLILKLNGSGAVQWAKQVGGLYSDSLGSVVVDGLGNVVVVGSFYGSINNIGGVAVNITGSGLLVKFDTLGVMQWAKTSPALSSMVMDGSGNLVGVDWGSVVKLNSSGVVQWSKGIGGSLYSVAVDSSGNIFAVGGFAGTITNLNGTPNLGPAPYGNGMLIKLNTSGTVQWTKAVGNSNLMGSGGSAVAVDSSGNVVAGFYFAGTISSLGSAVNVTSTGNNYDALLIKFGSDGTVISSARFGGPGSEYIRQISLSDSGIWFVGHSETGSSVWAVGNTYIRTGDAFVLGVASLPIVTPDSATPSSLAWGGSVATNNSVALGVGTYASGNGSAAMGSGTLASGGAAFTAGELSRATGYAATALGYFTSASNDSAFAAGERTEAKGYAATALGYYSIAAGEMSFAVGEESTANGYGSTALGCYSIATGEVSVAAGEWLTADATHVTVIGRLNVSQGNPTTWVPTDDLFVVGNGDADEWVPSNAFVVHKNGNVRAAGNVQSKGGFRTPPMGDLDMGSFTAGTNPAAPSTDAKPGLNAGLRYPTE